MEVASKASGGTAFGGDFLVSLTEGPRWEIALVDVSGKGIEAATRALQLNGALGGLLGSVLPESFLIRANRFLLRQDWDEGFATAVHLYVDVADGSYEIRSAGHPPVARFTSVTGEWTLAEAEGPALGLLQSPSFDTSVGRLDHGDALLLYTDGLVEVPGRDLSVGIDKLLGEATRLVVGGFDGGSARLLHQVAPDGHDDRAVVLLWRP
jgi:serine phosphatase RsbU (regulator of sigma subunit)